MNEKAEKLLNAIIRLFLRDGIKRITMDDIAADVGVSKVTLYKYFVDKDTLYYQVSQYLLANYIMALEGSIVSCEPLVQRLQNYLSVITEFINSGRLELCRELTLVNSDSEAEYARYSETYRRFLLTLIDEGIADGLIRNDLDRDMCFHYIDMGILYYEQNDMYRSRMLSDDDFRQRFMSFHIGNVFADRAKPLLDP